MWKQGSPVCIVYIDKKVVVSFLVDFKIVLKMNLFLVIINKSWRRTSPINEKYVVERIWSVGMILRP